MTTAAQPRLLALLFLLAWVATAPLGTTATAAIGAACTANDECASGNCDCGAANLRSGATASSSYGTTGALALTTAAMFCLSRPLGTAAAIAQNVPFGLATCSGVCVAANEDCVGSWSDCTEDCGNKTFSVTTPKSGTGSACNFSHDATVACAAGEGDCPAAGLSLTFVMTMGAWTHHDKLWSKDQPYYDPALTDETRPYAINFTAYYDPVPWADDEWGKNNDWSGKMGQLFPANKGVRIEDFDNASNFVDFPNMYVRRWNWYHMPNFLWTRLVDGDPGLSDDCSSTSGPGFACDYFFEQPFQEQFPEDTKLKVTYKVDTATCGVAYPDCSGEADMTEAKAADTAGSMAAFCCEVP